MIDFHSHILPSVDDGSKSVSESIKLLEMLSSQGADTVCATPHFLPYRESVEDFVKRRDEAYKLLIAALDRPFPQILLGAEVKFYDGISKLDSLSKLTVGDSRLLLVEMPMRKWSSNSVRELINLACTNEFIITLAHIERYLGSQSKDIWAELLGSGIIMQVNASFFNNRFSRHKAMKMLRESRIHLIGSDCHDTVNRPPDIGKAYELITKKMGENFASDFTEYQRALLSEQFR